MAYTIRLSDGLATITVPNGRIGNYGTPLQLVGTNVPDYGSSIFQNMIRITENFSNSVPPEDNIIVGGSPLTGQLWYNSSSKTLNYYTGTGWNELLDADTIYDPNFTVANASRFKNPLTMILYNDVSGSVTMTGNDFVALDPLYPTQLTNAVAMSVTVDKVDASKIVGDISANTANKLATPRAISLSGVVTGSVQFDGSSNANIHTAGNVDTRITLVGDVTGSAIMRNFGNVNITTSVNFSGHNHDSLYYRKSVVDAKIAAIEGGGGGDSPVIYTGGLGINVGGSVISADLSYLDTRYEQIGSGGGGQIDLSDYVRVSTTQTITGNKTFTGAVIVAGFVTANGYVASSDTTLKENKRPLEISDDIMDLELMQWEWTDVAYNGDRRGQTDSGVIAQDVEKIKGLEGCVVTDENGIKSVDYGKLAVHLILGMNKRTI